MRMQRFVICFLIALIFPAAICAQNAKKPLTLAECIAIALDNNTTIKTYQNLSELAAHSHKASLSGVLPTVSTSYSALRTRAGDGTTQRDVQVFDSTGQVVGIINQEVTLSGFERNSYSVSLDVGQNLFDGGRNINRIRQSKANQNAADHDLTVQVNRIIQEVASNYLDLVKQEKLLEVYTLAVGRSQDNLDKSQKMYEIGSIAKVDVFRARVNLGNDRIALINQKNTVQQARQTLNISLGYRPDEPVEIEREVQFDFELRPLDDLLHTAYENQPEIKRLEMDLRAQEIGVSINKGTFLPTLTGFFSYGRDNTVFNKIYTDINQNWNVTVGVRGSWNLFNGFNDQVNYQNAKIRARNARIALEDYKRTLTANITTLYQNYRDLQEIIQIDQENLEAAREEYRLATERFRLGSGTSLDVREAQVNLTDAERILVTAESNLVITYAKLQEAVGQIQDRLKF